MVEAEEEEEDPREGDAREDTSPHTHPEEGEVKEASGGNLEEASLTKVPPRKSPEKT